MKIYLAAQYHRKEEMAEYSRHLRSAGIEVTSSWPDEPYSPTSQLGEVSESNLVEIAERDVNEIMRCDTLIFFSVSDQEWTRRNGRMVEFGIALALDKRMIVCGPRENIFHYLSDVEVYPEWSNVLTVLGANRDWEQTTS